MSIPHTIYHLARKEHLMTDEDRAELLADGWQPEVIESLARRGFRPCLPDMETLRREHACPGKSAGFVRQTSKPHLYITIQQDPFVEVVLEQIDTAIYREGGDAGHDEIATLFERFVSRAKVRRRREDPEIAELKREIATLKARTRKISAFFEGTEWRGAMCSCGYSTATGDRQNDEAAIAAHICTNLP